MTDSPDWGISHSSLVLDAVPYRTWSVLEQDNWKYRNIRLGHAQGGRLEFLHIGVTGSNQQGISNKVRGGHRDPTKELCKLRSRTNGTQKFHTSLQIGRKD